MVVFLPILLLRVPIVVRMLGRWSPTGKAPAYRRYLAQCPCGATLPVWRRDRPAYDGAFLLPVSIGGSPAAGTSVQDLNGDGVESPYVSQ